MINSLHEVYGPIFGLFAGNAKKRSRLPPWGFRYLRYCVQPAGSAKFMVNVHLRPQVIRQTLQFRAAGFACSAAAPLGATSHALSVGAYKTGKVLRNAPSVKSNGALSQSCYARMREPYVVQIFD